LIFRFRESQAGQADPPLGGQEHFWQFNAQQVEKRARGLGRLQRAAQGRLRRRCSG